MRTRFIADELNSRAFPAKGRDMMVNRTTLIRTALLAGAVMTAGCQNVRRDASIHGEMFPRDEQLRPVDRFLEIQSAAAARNDATLNAFHFDRGAALNSLGREKLDLMLRGDDQSLPLVVYLDVRSPGGAADAHRDSVRRYLVDHGVADEQLKFRTGPNLEHTRPAREGLRGLKKFNGETTDAAAEPDKPWASVDPLGTPAKK